MKRSLFYLLLVVILAGWIGTLVARDPGYVLISYDGATLQTGLWVMLALLVISGVSIYYLWRLASNFGGAANRFRTWGSERKRTRAVQQTARGLIYLQEGDFERAEKFLISGAENHESPAVNFIALAKTANARDDAEQRETYLRQALDAGSEVKQAVAIAASEMAASRGDWKASLGHLNECKDNPSTLNLKKEALLQLGEWASIEKLMPQLRKFNSQASLDAVEREVVLHRLLERGLNDDELLSIYKKAPEPIRIDEAVVLAFCTAIQNEKEAEAVLRNILRQSWNEALVEAYGSLGTETLKRRIKTAEGWNESHGDSAAVQLCLGRLFEAAGDRDKAKQAFEKSIANGNTSSASQHLANLFAFDGDFKKSNEYLKIALGNVH